MIQLFSQKLSKETKKKVLFLNSLFWGNLGRLHLKTVIILLLLNAFALTLSAQLLSKTYPKETLASRLISISKDYKTNIGYRPEQCNFEIPALVLTKADINQALKKSLVSTGFTIKTMSDGSIAIRKEDAPAPRSSTPGRLSGLVTDDKGEPIIGASVIIPGTGKGTVTDVNGNFTLQVPAVETTIEVSFLSYQKKKITGIEIRPDKTTRLNIILNEDNKQLSEVTVTAQTQRASTTGLLLSQKSSVSMSNGISAEQIKALPDNNLGQVLKRVTGLTIQDNKFVTVRGMSERYNNVQLNGALMPSTEPNRRNFSFDIIPSNLVDNVVVYKTFSPDLPAEFSGGMVLISTLNIPKEPFLSLSVGSGFNTNSTGKEFRSSKRYTSDYFGGGNERTWMNTSFDVDGFFSVYSPGNVDTEEGFAKTVPYNTSIPNHWGLYTYTAQPMQAYSLSVGKPLNINDHSIGLVAAVTYRHEETIEDYDAMLRDKVEYVTNNGKNYSFTTSLGVLANVAWKYKNNTIAWRNLYNRRFTNSNNEYDMGNENGSYSYEYYTSTLMTSLWQSRLEGNHEILDKHIKINWFADKNKLNREQPDDRYSKAIYDSIATGRGVLSYDLSTPSASSGGYIMASLYEETKSNIGANIEWNTKIRGREQKLKFGYMGTFRDASAQMLGLKTLSTNANVSLTYGMPDYILYDTDKFSDNLYYYVVNTGSGGADKYTGTQNIHAGYAMVDVNPLTWFRFTGGYRYEHSVMKVSTATRTFSPRLAWNDSTSTYTEANWLPVASAIVNFTPEIALRLSYSKTITRPDFRERSAYSYYDVNEKANIFGNSGLVGSYSHNYDARVEWYPTPGEILSAGVFSKKFINPAEMVTVAQPSGGYLFFYFNLDQATVQGMEFELRKSLGFIAPDSKILSDIYLTGNATFMTGNVTYNADKLLFESGLTGNSAVSDTIMDEYRDRTLQGLAPYVLNAGISYKGKHLGFNVSYNRSGDVLKVAGSTIEDDEYELGRNVIDLQLSYKLLKEKLEIKLNASDLLAQPYIRFRNTNPKNTTASYKDDPEGIKYNEDYDWILKKTQKGNGYSLSVSYKF